MQNVDVSGGGWTRARKYSVRFAMAAFSCSVILGVVWTVVAPTSTAQAERATVSGFLIAAVSALAGTLGYLRGTRSESMSPGADLPAPSSEPRSTSEVDHGTSRREIDSSNPIGSPQASPTSVECLTENGASGPDGTPHRDDPPGFRLAVTMKAPDGTPILLEAFDIQSATILINQFVWLDPSERRGND